jgi:putative ABC transport system ATP-binding protein
MTATAIALAKAQTDVQPFFATTSAIPRLNVRGLRLARGGGIIEIPDFSLEAGQALALVGPSGCGKTTALMAMSLMLRPAAGTIAVDGVEPWTFAGHARDRFRGQRIGLIFQSFHLVDALSVRSNIALAARCAGRSIELQRLELLLAQLGLAEIADRRSDRISHGQAQRVAVARALMNRPSIILADEPTSALDDHNAEALLALLKASAATEGAALLITTHDRRILDKVDRIVTLGGGT